MPGWVAYLREKRSRRMPKVSHAMLISVGLIGPKVRPIGVTDGLQFKITVLNYSDKDFKGGRNGKNLSRTIMARD